VTLKTDLLECVDHRYTPSETLVALPCYGTKDFYFFKELDISYIVFGKYMGAEYILSLTGTCTPRKVLVLEVTLCEFLCDVYLRLILS